MTSSLGPPVGGPTNRERTGERDLCVSSALRRVPDVRFIDVDFVQYDPRSRDIEVVVEASSDIRKSSEISRRIAKQLGAYAVLLIHRYKDNTHVHPVLVTCWHPTGTKLLAKQEMSWSEFLTYMRSLHDEHLAYRTENAA